MKTVILIAGFAVGVLCAPTYMAAGDESAVQVKVNRSLTLVTVRTMDADTPWFVVQESFVANFSKSLSSSDGKAMPVRTVPLSASSAAERLRSGECEAVFVLGEQLPSALKNSKFVATKVVSQMGSPVYVFYLVTKAGDEVAKTTLIPAFEQATDSASFKETVSRATAVKALATAHNQ